MANNKSKMNVFNGQLNKGDQKLALETKSQNVVLLDPAGFINNNTIDHEDLVVYANLVAKVRPKTLITNKDEQKILELTFIKEESVSLPEPLGKSFLTTDWTEIGSMNSQLGQDLETFGITSIEMEMGSGFKPQITINFTDIRGATLFEQGSCSPYGAFFYQPWPRFELTVKGYYGDPVKYALSLKSFNTKFNASNGNYESTAEFIGYSYAFLSDILLAYVLASPYIEGSEEKLKKIYEGYLEHYNKMGYNQDNLTQMSRDFLLNGQSDRPLTLKNYLDKVQQLQSNEGQDSSVIAQLEGSQELKTLTEAEKLDRFLADILTAVSDFETAWEDATPNGTNVSENVLKWGNNSNNIDINKQNELRVLKIDAKTGIDLFIKAYNDKISEISLGEDFKVNDQNFKEVKDDITGIEINLRDLVLDVNTKLGNLKTKVIQLRKDFTTKATQLIKEKIGFVPTIRSFFTVLLANTDLFLELLRETSFNAENYHNSKTDEEITSIIKSQDVNKVNELYYAWPTYVISKENKGKTEQYPGTNPKFRNWYEVKFVEKFIKALQQMQKDINDPNQTENDNIKFEGKPGYDNYVAINAMESPGGEPTCNISYFNLNTEQNVYKTIGERFIVYNNMSSLNNFYLNSSLIFKAGLWYRNKVNNEGYYNFSFQHLRDSMNKDYPFSSNSDRTNWGKIEAINLYNTIYSDKIFRVIKEASKDKETFTQNILKALGFNSTNETVYDYSKDIVLNPKEGAKTLKPNIHDMDTEALIKILPCENCTGSVDQGTSGSIIDINEILRGDVTNSRALKLNEDNLIVTTKLLDEEVKNTGFVVESGSMDQEGMIRLIDLSKSSLTLDNSEDFKWWRYNGIKLRKSAPWLTQGASIGDKSILLTQDSRGGQYAKNSPFSQTTNLAIYYMCTAEIYPNFSFNYYLGHKDVFNTKTSQQFADFNYAFNQDIGELTTVKGRVFAPSGTEKSLLNSGWYTILPNVVNNNYSNYDKKKAELYFPKQFELKTVYYSPGSTDEIYSKDPTIKNNYAQSLLANTNNQKQDNRLQIGEYNKNWYNQGNLLIDTPFWRHNFPSNESNSTTTNTFSYTMFGSSLLQKTKFTTAGTERLISDSRFYAGIKLNLDKGLGTYIGFKSVENNGLIGSTEKINMLTTHNQEDFKVTTKNFQVLTVTNPTNLNRTEAWKGSLAYLFLANQLHRPWTSLYTNSNTYLGPQGILSTGSMTSVIPKQSVYLLGAVLWRMRESGLFISDDPKWDMQPQQSFINGKYVDPLNVPLLPEEITIKYKDKTVIFNSKYFGSVVPNETYSTTNNILNVSYQIESDQSTLGLTFPGQNGSTFVLVSGTKISKNGNTLTITAPSTTIGTGVNQQSITPVFTYKCGTNNNYIATTTFSSTNLSDNSPIKFKAGPGNNIITLLKNNFCKKPSTTYKGSLKYDIENGTYTNNNGVRPPLASLLVNFNSYNRDNDDISGVICFPRADEWPTPNLGMIYAVDLDDDIYEKYDVKTNPFKNQYKIFTPILGERGAEALRITNQNYRFRANEETVKKANESNTKDAALSSIITNSNVAGPDETYAKLSFIYHDINNLESTDDIQKENGRSLRGKVRDKSINKNTQETSKKSLDEYTKAVIKETSYNGITYNAVPNLNEGFNSSFKTGDGEEKGLNGINFENSNNNKNSLDLDKENAKGYLRGYLPIGPEIWFLPTKVKQEFINLFESFVGNFNEFEDSSDFDFILKTIDPLNFPKPELTRNTTPDTQPMTGTSNIPKGLPDDLTFLEFSSIEAPTTKAPWVTIPASSGNLVNIEPTIHPSVQKYVDTYTVPLDSPNYKNLAEVNSLGRNEQNTKFKKLYYNILNIDNPDVQEVHKMLFKDGFVLTHSTPRIWSGELRVENKSGKEINFNTFRFKKTDLDNFINGFVEVMTGSDIEQSQIQKIQEDVLGDGSYSVNGDDDLRLSTYRSFKSIYDQWISASSEDGNLFYNSIGQDRYIIEHFSFVNRVNADIGDKVILNVNEIGGLMSNYTMSVFGVCDDVLSKNNFNFHPLAGYVDLSINNLTNFNEINQITIEDKGNALSRMFSPLPTSAAFSDRNLSGAHYLCMYVGGYSKLLNLSSSSNGAASQKGCIEEFRDGKGKDEQQLGDGFSFTKNPPEDFVASDDSAGVVAFKVKFGSENQSHFISVDLDQSQFKNTQESLLAIEKIAAAGDPSNTGGFVTKGQSLYDVYLNRSYSCTVEALGNMMIQPLQYFELEGVPMFKGSYLIRDVKHSITPNHVKTTFTGDRIPQAVVPLIEDVISAFQLLPSDKVSGNLGNINNTGDFTSTDRIQKGVAIVNRLMSDLSLTKEQAAGVVGNLIKESGLVPDILQSIPFDPNKRGTIPQPVSSLGYSWAQWTSSRQQSFIDYAKTRNFDLTTKPATDEIAYGFLVEEMSTFYVKDFLKNLKNKKTVQDASIYFAKVYEGCAACSETKEQQERIGYANQVLDALQTNVDSINFDKKVYGDNSNKKCPNIKGITDGGVGDGYIDGKLYKIRLCKVQGATVNVDIAENLNNMLNAANAAGVKLKPGSSFRTMENQINTAKGNGCYKSNKYLRKDCNVATAKPGYSNHQSGLAIDFTCEGQTICYPNSSKWCKEKGASLKPKEYPCFKWLIDNAANYKFFNYEAEAWHWSIDGN